MPPVTLSACANPLDITQVKRESARALPDNGERNRRRVCGCVCVCMYDHQVVKKDERANATQAVMM